MDGSAPGGERRELSTPEVEMNEDARAAVASMVRASRAIAEASESLAREAKRVVDLSGQARDLELAAERRMAARPERPAAPVSETTALPSRLANPRLGLTIVAGLVVVLMVGAVAVGALRERASRIPELLPSAGASYMTPPPPPADPPLRPVPAEPSPVLPAREPIPAQYLPQGMQR